jgi:hypothetical protein
MLCVEKRNRTCTGNSVKTKLIGGVRLARRLSPRIIASPDLDLVQPLVVCQEVPSNPIYLYCSTNFVLRQKARAG